jgi:hypothetical protein
VLLVDPPSRWRAVVKWIVVLGILGAGALYGPEMWQRLRTAATPTVVSSPQGPPVLVARDSGLTQPPQPPAQQPVETATPVVEAPRPVAPTPAAAPRPAPPQPRPAVTTTAAPARLFVNSTPWGQLYIDGRLVGNTPQANLVVAAGAHRVRVAREGFQAWERAVQLAPGQELRITDIVLQAVGP